MQASYGEEQVQIEDFICGSVRVLAIYSEPALYPRIGIRLGWRLNDIQPQEGSHFQRGGLTDYQIVDLAAELRVGLGGGGPLVGLLWSSQGNIEIRSSPYQSETQLGLACDLDLARLEAIEERRSGQKAQFSINMWPTVIRDGHRARARGIQLSFQIPRDDWLEFLGAVRFGDYDILEIKRPVADFEAFQDVRNQLTAARVRIDRGEYNAAVGAIRTALEAAIQQSKDGESPLREMLISRTDDVRGAGYTAIVKQVKDICSRVVHKPDATVTITRAEALFLVRAAETCISFLGGLCLSEVRNQTSD